MFIEHSWKKSQSSEGAKHMSIAQKCFAPTTGKKKRSTKFHEAVSAYWCPSCGFVDRSCPRKRNQENQIDYYGD
jgi:hypothetical protein